jgi:hypothetical protein
VVGRVLKARVRAFTTVLTERRGERPADWPDAVRRDDLPSFHAVAAAIDRGRDAVVAANTLPWNSGPFDEGHVDRARGGARGRSRGAPGGLTRRGEAGRRGSVAGQEEAGEGGGGEEEGGDGEESEAHP